MATNNEEIIERKEKSPVATSCLIIATLAIIGAIALQISELAEIRAQYNDDEKISNRVTRVSDGPADGDIGKINGRIQGILDGSHALNDERAQEAKKRGEEIKKAAEAEARGRNTEEAAQDNSAEETPAEPAEEPPLQDDKGLGDEPDEGTPSEPPAPPAEETPADPSEEDSAETKESLDDL